MRPPDPDDTLGTAIEAVLCAGVTPRPPRSLQVEALAEAYRQAAADPRGFRIWFRERARLGGLRENAALVAALRTPSRDEAVAAYLEAHPDRDAVVHLVLLAQAAAGGPRQYGSPHTR